MRLNEKALIFLTFLFTCGALALLIGSLVTEYWVTAKAVRASNLKSEGHINFGLFKGTKILNHGFGERVYEFSVVDVQYREKDFLIRELYAVTVASVCASLLFGIICAGQSLYNTSFTATEAVCHFPGQLNLYTVAF
jgi:hypothetical protein